MSFFNFLLLIILLCWIISLQGKVDDLSATLKLVRKKINDYEKYALAASNLKSTKLQEKSESVKDLEVVELQKVSDSVENVNDVKFPLPDTKSGDDVVSSKSFEQQTYKVVNEKFDFQKALLGNVFNKIGALAIVISIIILVKLVSPFIILTPTMKFMLGVLLGFGFLISGFVLHKKDNLKNYSEVLLGTGIATLFITSFCGYSILDLYNSTVAMVIGGALLVSTYLMADRMKTVSMLVIGLIGGYLVPMFTNSGYEQCFAFLIFLNAVSAIFTLRCKKFNLINPINITLTMFYALFTYLLKPEPDIIYPIVLWGIYIVYDLLRDKSSFVDYVASWINYVVLTFFSLIMFHNAHEALGILFAVSALIYMILAWVSRLLKNELFKTYEHFVLLNVWLYIVFILNDVQSVLAWAIIALIVSIFIAVNRLNYLTPSVVLFYSTTFVGAMLAHSGDEYCLIAKYLPVANVRTLIFVLPLICMLFSSLLLKSNSKKASNWLKFLGLSMGYIYLLGEINSYLMNIDTSVDFIDFNRLMIFSMIAFVYSLNAKKVSKISESILFGFASYVIFAIATILLLCGNFWYPDGYLPLVNFRFGAYVLAIISCCMFSRWDKLDLFKYLAILFGFLLVHTESVGISKLYGAVWQYLISLSWVLYSGVATIIGIVNNRRVFLNMGIALIILTIARIFIYDLARVDAFYKLIAFLALGIILMLVSYIYTSNKNKR